PYKSRLATFFIRQLIRNHHYKDAENYINKYDARDEHFYLEEILLDEVAKKGLLDTGLECLQHGDPPCLASHRHHFFITQLVRHGHEDKAFQYMKNIPTTFEWTKRSLANAFITGLGRLGKTQEAEEYIEFFSSHFWSCRNDLRQDLISVLIEEG